MKSLILTFLVAFTTTLLIGQSVGINTTTPNPSFALDINGNAISKGLRLAGNENFLLMETSNNPNNFFQWKANQGYLRTAYNTVSPFYFKNLIVVDSTGKVGIGESNPTTWFDVSNSFGGQAARFNGGNNMWITLSENGTNRGYIGSFLGNAEDVDFATYGGNTTGSLHLGTSSTRRLSIDPAGNVGIGTLPTTGNRLTVQGGDLVKKEVGSVSRMQFESDQSNAIDFYVDGIHKHKIISSENSMLLTRAGGGLFGLGDIRINEDGNVGINSILTNPVSKFQIYSSTDASYTSHGAMVLGTETGNNVVFDINEILARNNGLEADLFIQNDGGNLLLCGDEQGAVGIGISSSANLPAGSLLAVDGKITCEEVLVKLSQNWPDYVFADEYKLTPLSEVKSFIEKNKHLPGIPKAIDIEKDGLHVGEVQRKMMEKIEELTLYVIKLQEEIEELKSKKN